jgi:hypothetical protein
MATEKVSEKLCKQCNRQFSDYPCEPSECYLLGAVENAVEVVHAHWIPDDYYDICSHCNNLVVLHDRRKPDRFCRNCGAMMDGGNNG